MPNVRPPSPQPPLAPVAVKASEVSDEKAPGIDEGQVRTSVSGSTSSTPSDVERVVQPETVRSGSRSVAKSAKKKVSRMLGISKKPT